MDGIRIGDFEETHLAEFAERDPPGRVCREVEFERRTQRGRSWIGDFEETHLAEFAETYLAEFAERLSLSEELSEVEAGSEILQVE
ncbi:hypothetical protein FCV25MIE_30072, partial [Fagus crenata]